MKNLALMILIDQITTEKKDLVKEEIELEVVEEETENQEGKDFEGETENVRYNAACFAFIFIFFLVFSVRGGKEPRQYSLESHLLKDGPYFSHIIFFSREESPN